MNNLLGRPLSAPFTRDTSSTSRSTQKHDATVAEDHIHRLVPSHLHHLLPWIIKKIPLEMTGLPPELEHDCLILCPSLLDHGDLWHDEIPVLPPPQEPDEDLVASVVNSRPGSSISRRPASSRRLHSPAMVTLGSSNIHRINDIVSRPTSAMSDKVSVNRKKTRSATAPVSHIQSRERAIREIENMINGVELKDSTATMAQLQCDLNRMKIRLNATQEKLRELKLNVTESVNADTEASDTECLKTVQPTSSMEGYPPDRVLEQHESNIRRIKIEYRECLTNLADIERRVGLDSAKRQFISIDRSLDT